MQELILELLNHIKTDGLTDEIFIMLDDLIDALICLPGGNSYISDILPILWKHKEEIPDQLINKINYLLEKKQQPKGEWPGLEELLETHSIIAKNGKKLNADDIKRSNLSVINTRFNTRAMNMITGEYLLNMTSDGKVFETTAYDCRKEQPFFDKRIFNEYGDVAFHAEQ